jgi:hypothetical protein
MAGSVFMAKNIIGMIFTGRPAYRAKSCIFMISLINLFEPGAVTQLFQKLVINSRKIHAPGKLFQ